MLSSRQSYLLGHQTNLLSLVQNLPKDVIVAGKHNVAGAHITYLDPWRSEQFDISGFHLSECRPVSLLQVRL